MVNNLELIKPLLKFESDDDYYFLQILQRKKDNADLDKRLMGNNNSARLIKGYYIKSVEHLMESTKGISLEMMTQSLNMK
jgi:hypothetical protein